MSAEPESVVRLAEELAAVISAFVHSEIAVLAASNDPAPNRLLSIDAAARRLSVGRSRLYQELASGRLRSLKVGRRRLIPESAIYEYVRGLEASARTERE